MRSLVRNFIHGIRNLIDWFPIVWNDRDFDHSYLLELLEFKLKRIEKFFNSDNCWSDLEYEPTKTAIKKLHHALILINYLLESKHFDVSLRKHYKKFPPDRNFLFSLRRPGEKESFDKAEAQDERLRSVANEKLFGILKDYYEYWWD